MLIKVALPIPYFDPFIYDVPRLLESKIQIGKRVVVPLRNQSKLGMIVEQDTKEIHTNNQIKAIIDILDTNPIITPLQLHFIKWLASYYLVSLGEVIQIVFSYYKKPIKIDFFIIDQTSQRFLALNEQEQAAISALIYSKNDEQRLNQYYNQALLKKVQSFKLPKDHDDTIQEIVLIDQQYQAKENTKTAFLIEQITKAKTKSIFLNEIHQHNKSALYYLKKKNVLQIINRIRKEKSIDQNQGNDSIDFKNPIRLNEEQEKIVRLITDDKEQNRIKTYLLHGVTGSGKTEVYKNIAHTCIKKDQQILILLPEILLVNEIYKKFMDRFSEAILLQFHSRLTQKQRFLAVEKIKAKKSKIIIATRSALFLPLDQLGFIIVDEEHDQSLKQNESPFFHARDSAVYLANLLGCSILLGSATPSLESYHNATTGKYHLLQLNARVLKRKLPQLQYIDLKHEAKAHNIFYFSEQLKTKLEENVLKKKQVLLFLNRRGFARLLKCNNCRECYYCKSCTVPMKFHKHNHLMSCHLCDAQEIKPDFCSICQGRYSLVGFGTQMVEEDMKRCFPDATISRIDRDAFTKIEEFQEEIEKIKQKEIDIIVGTQMITKGFDIENIGLVAVLLADSELYISDFRGNERIFQILTQVAGRSGRNDQFRGEVLIQTYNPQHYAIQAALKNDYQAFYQHEIENRLEFNMPPFSKIIQVILNDPDEMKVKLSTKTLFEYMQQMLGNDPIEIYGPFEATIYKQRGRYFWQILLKSASWKSLHQYCRAVFWQGRANKMTKGVRLSINVDA